jgi:hypothetical protein
MAVRSAERPNSNALLGVAKVMRRSPYPCIYGRGNPMTKTCLDRRILTGKAYGGRLYECKSVRCRLPALSAPLRSPGYVQRTFVSHLRQFFATRRYHRVSMWRTSIPHRRVLMSWGRNQSRTRSPRTSQPKTRHRLTNASLPARRHKSCHLAWPCYL